MLYLEGLKHDKRGVLSEKEKKNPDKALACLTAAELFPLCLLDSNFKLFFFFFQQPKGFKILLLKEKKKMQIKRTLRAECLA